MAWVGHFDAIALEVDDETWSRRRREDASPELIKARKVAAGALLAVAIIQVVCGIAMIFLLPQIMGGPVPEEVMTVLIVTIVAVVVVFSLLAWWALYQPLPPAILGLVLYSVLFLIDLIAAGGQLPAIALMIRLGIIAMLIAGLQSAIKANSMS